MNCLKLPFSVKSRPLLDIVDNCFNCCLFYIIEVTGLREAENDSDIKNYKNKKDIIIDIEPSFADINEESEKLKLEIKEKTKLNEKLDILLNEYDIVIDDN